MMSASMKIFVLNAGSSSLKYQVFDMPSERVLARGMADNIGYTASFVDLKTGAGKWKFDEEIKTHEQAIGRIIGLLTAPGYGILNGLAEVAAIGHRIVHGGEIFKDSALIDDAAIEAMEGLVDLGPLHMPANITGIRAARKLMPGKPNVACFDTAFHQSMPPEVYMYPIPVEYYEKYRVRRYGFHGTSHKYLAQEAARLLGLPQPNLVLCHIGSGSSVCAVRAGESFDTSMGMTPLEGLMMVTRSGDIDPAVIPYLMARTGKDAREVERILNKESGLRAIAGGAGDMRDIRDAYTTDPRARLARDMFTYRVKKYVGSYMAALGRTDAIVFAGGIGERAEYIRSEVLAGLGPLGVRLDEDRNRAEEARGGNEQILISAPDSAVKVFVIPTNEELMIARDAYRLVM